MITVMSSNKEAEQAVLGAVLKGGSKAFEASAEWIKNKRAFYYRFNSSIWDAMELLYKAKEPIDPVTLVNMLKKNITNFQNDTAYYVSCLYEECPVPANVVEYSKIVWEKFIRREAQRSAHILSKVAADDTKEIGEILHKHAKLADEIERLSPKRNETIETIIDSTLESIKSGSNVVPFGLEYLDAPAGGMTRREITVIGGRPGHGKTTLMINIVRSLVDQNYNVLLFNREMSNDEMMKKIIVMESQKLEYDKVRKHKINGTSEHLLSMRSKVIEKYKTLTMFDNIRTLEDSITEVRRLKPDVVIDDYIQLIGMGDPRDGRRFQIEKIMYEYKWLAKQCNCSAILISQLNREIERRDDPVPKMSDYSESGVIEQTAEAALFVYYPHAVDPSIEDEYEARIIAAKSRYGRISRFTVGYDGNKCRFYDTVADARKKAINPRAW